MGGDPSLGLGRPPAPQRPHPAHYSWFGSGWNLAGGGWSEPGESKCPQGTTPQPCFHSNSFPGSSASGRLSLHGLGFPEDRAGPAGTRKQAFSSAAWTETSLLKRRKSWMWIFERRTKQKGKGDPGKELQSGKGAEGSRAPQKQKRREAGDRQTDRSGVRECREREREGGWGITCSP